MTLGTEKLLLRSASEFHRSFIISTWVKSYMAQARKLGFSQFFREPESAERMWDRAIVLTDDDGYVVYGWAVGSEHGLDYVYVVPELRGNGVGKLLASTVTKADARNRLVYAGPSWLLRMPFNPYNFFKEK